ncbi:MAG: family 10 glycosylhydrolase [Ruminococcus sp.]|nr:family 10 glycosylhydrolase [Ruminococcus sp.]
MKKRILWFLLICISLLTACGSPAQSGGAPGELSDLPYTYPDGSIAPEDGESGYIPVNFTGQHGIWLPYMDFENYMYRKSEEEFRAAAKELLEEASENGVNTVYFHVHPNGDAYYDSEIFPRGVYYDGDYDPLAIMTEIAHSMGISLHAWINPLRLQTEEQMSRLEDNFVVKKWIDEGSPNVRLVDGRWYLNPAYDEVIDLVSETVGEILDKYQVDGIHIDDYFYPTQEADFDSEAFESSGESDLSAWRRNNVNRMVRAIYDTVKKHGGRLKFGISPQGNVDTDVNKLYADVKLWCREDGYADYIVPQIYYGFRNEVCPFESTLHRWEELCKDSDISLIIGLAGYKVGEKDKWAGESGENEWIEDPDVLKKQIELVEESSASGYAVYY